MLSLIKGWGPTCDLTAVFIHLKVGNVEERSSLFCVDSENKTGF